MHVHKGDHCLHSLSLSLSLTLSLPPTSGILCHLAKVCAEVCSACGSTVNEELMGGFRALCLPQNILKSCHTGYVSLTQISNVSVTLIIIIIYNKFNNPLSPCRY